MTHQQESFHPFPSQQGLSCFLSHVAKGSIPKSCGPNSSPCRLVPTSAKASWSQLTPPKLHGPPLVWLLPGFKSQCQSSSAALFPTPPTISYTCRHSCILPALLGCHSKSGQLWPHGMEPIISKLSHRPCNQGELLPSPILGGIWSHPPGSKHGHSYLTHP